MGSNHAHLAILFFFLAGPWMVLHQCSAIRPLDNATAATNNTAVLYVDLNPATQRKMPDNLFGVFFEEINHAGTGGLWAELVNNRGFESRDKDNKQVIDPWGVIGDASAVNISTDSSSLFPRNKIALKVEVLCDKCPDSGVGVFNPGFWGMNIVKGKEYKVIFYVRSSDSVDLDVALTESQGQFNILATHHVHIDNVKDWKKVEFTLTAKEADKYARLTLTTTKKGVLWLDQVSVMASDTYKGHGFRKDLFNMIHDLKPGFIRFPGGNFVEGNLLINCLDWKHTVGPWEHRPGHFDDAWGYWTDDGFGHFEYLQFAEDLGALPIWVFSIGISINGDEVPQNFLYPYIQDALDGLEFAIGSKHTTWGSIRAAMGHPEPFDLRYVAPGNEDCGKKEYDSTYRQFFAAIREAYPDIKIITNCDGSQQPLNFPADLYDYHTYPEVAVDMFNLHTHFDNSSRNGPKAFVSEYAVWGKAPGNGNLIAALAESAFLMGLERNSDIVEFASYAPLLVNNNDRTWNPDAIVFDSHQAYGTPSYWMQTFFRASNGAMFLNSTLTRPSVNQQIVASVISYHHKKDSADKVRVKIVNYGDSNLQLNVVFDNLSKPWNQAPDAQGLKLTSDNVLDENSFANPRKIAPKSFVAAGRGNSLQFDIAPHSLNSFDILKSQL